MEMKKCTCCGIEYPFTNEYFNYRDKRKGKLRGTCKKCAAEKVRRSKAKSTNKKEIVSVEFSKKEKDLLMQKAKECDYNISQYIRYISLKSEVVLLPNLIDVEPIEKVVNGFEYQLNKIGVNINEISHNLNKGGYIDNKTVLKLVEVMEKIDKRMSLIEYTMAKAYKVFD